VIPSPDAPVAVLEHIRRDQAARACEHQTARVRKRERLLHEFAEVTANAPPDKAEIVAAWSDTLTQYFDGAEAKFGDQLAERTAEGLDALAAGDRRLRHRLDRAGTRQRHALEAALSSITVDRSPPPPGALIRSIPAAAHAPPSPVCSRRSSGTVWTVGHTLSHRSLRR